MNIKDNSLQPKFKMMRFNLINCGEAFEYEGNLYIKIHIMDNRYNAISLESGRPGSFTIDTMVHQLHKCEITYEKCLQEEE